MLAMYQAGEIPHITTLLAIVIIVIVVIAVIAVIVDVIVDISSSPLPPSSASEGERLEGSMVY